MVPKCTQVGGAKVGRGYISYRQLAIVAAFLSSSRAVQVVSSMFLVLVVGNPSTVLVYHMGVLSTTSSLNIN